MFLENLRLAFSSLSANKTRAFLTMLGIIIGIASVIAILTVGNSLTMSVSTEMQSMGANNVTIYVDKKDVVQEKRENGIVFGKSEEDHDMTEDDLITDEMIYEMMKAFPDTVEAVSARMQMGAGTVTKATDTVSVNVFGVSRGFFVENKLTFLSGEPFSAAELGGARNVAIVSDKFCRDYFGEDGSSCLGKEIDLSVNDMSITCTVVAIYEYQQTMVMLGQNTVTNLYLPITTAQNLNHSKNYADMTVVTKVGVDSNQAAKELKDYLNGFYRSNPYFEIDTYSLASLADSLNEMMGTITTAISVIAGIALLVGGIGVMNIMMVSITERTREIGTRKALGASTTHIRTQFIVEAMIICLVGGAIGVALGLVLGALGAKILGYPASPTVGSVLIALLFSMGIGLFFGYYPANKAAKMNPIDALRYE